MEVATKGQYNVCFVAVVGLWLIWIKAPYIPSVLFRGMLAAKYRMWLVLPNSCDWNTHCCLFAYDRILPWSLTHQLVSAWLNQHNCMFGFDREG